MKLTPVYTHGPACVLRPFRRWSDQLRRDSVALKAFKSHMYSYLLRCCWKSHSLDSAFKSKPLFFAYISYGLANTWKIKQEILCWKWLGLDHHAVSQKDYSRREQCRGDFFSARRSDATCPLSCQFELRSVKAIDGHEERAWRECR